MEQKKRIRAISLTKNVFWLLFGLVGAFYIYYKADIYSESHLACLLAILIIVSCCATYYLVHTVYLTEFGVECYRFGIVYRKLPWSQIGQISVVRDLRWSANVSNSPRIVITPVDCEKYNEDWSGIKYLFVFRHQVAWIDYTKKNIDFIEKHYGKIIDFVYGDTDENV